MPNRYEREIEEILRNLSIRTQNRLVGNAPGHVCVEAQARARVYVNEGISL